MATNSELVLGVSGLDAGYGHVRVIRGADVGVGPGEVVGLIGRNGAGKTTFLSSLAGLVRSERGRILLRGVDIAGWPANRRVKAGLAIVPSGGRLFKSLTIEENLTLADIEGQAERLESVFALFPELRPMRDRYAGRLSGGERQMVAIGRALMLRPSMLLMDEPSEGLAPMIVARVVETIKALQKTGVSILVAEQNIRFANTVCQRWYAIDKGSIAAVGGEATIEQVA